MGNRQEFVDTALGRFTPDSLQFMRLCAIAEATQLRLMSWAMDNLRDVDGLLDIGANLGTYAVFLGRHGACKSIHAFEPTPETAREFQRNMALNFPDAAERVNLHQIALSDSAGEVQLEVGRPFDTGNRIIGPKAKNPGRTIPVPMKPLDEIVGPGSRSLLMKVDVEGHEVRVLAGAGATLSSRVALAQIETWPRGNRRQDVRATMVQHGFRYLFRVKGDQFFLHEDHAGSADDLCEVHAEHMDGMIALNGWLAREGGKVLHDPAFRADALAHYNGVEQIRIGSFIQRLRQKLGGRNG